MSASARRTPVPSITARPSPDEKALFSGIASARGISESRLALMAIRTVIGYANVQSKPAGRIKDDPSPDRVTIRLRPGDKSALRWRAAQRGMKISTYLASLVRAHLAAQPPLSVNELAALKQCIAVLAGLGTVFVKASRQPPQALDRTDLRRQLELISAAIADLERRTHEFARAGLMSWETRRD